MTSESAQVGVSGASAPGTTLSFEPHHCFACGELNEHGLRLALHTNADRCRTELTLGPTFSGWAELAHGGIVATILDEVMAWAVIGQGTWGMTARMRVAYHQPVRVGAPLVAEGRVTEGRRRLWQTAGELRDGAGTLLASAEATYVEIPAERQAELRARYRPLVETPR